MKEERGGFLSRWSRLKRGDGADTLSAGPEAVAPETEQPPTLPDGRSLEELIAELPNIEDLVPGQSLRAFMQPWVPAALRNAALQSMWRLDPAISGYVDPALDYAHDYNAIGGVPGFGPMEASRETVREVHEMFDRALGHGPEAAVETAGNDDEKVSDIVTEPSPPAPAVQHGQTVPRSTEKKEVAMAISTATAASGEDAGEDATQNGKPADARGRPRIRRHGRALPA